MKQYCNFCILYYSRLLSLSLIGDFTYLIQHQLLNFGLLKSFFASNKKTKYRKILFEKMSQKFEKIYCKSFAFARDLQVFENNELILDISNIKKLSKMDKEELYNLMWSLVFCKSVTKRTKNSLKNFLPKNYPVTGDPEISIL